MSGRGLVLEMPGTWLCGVLIGMCDGRASAVFDLAQNVTRDGSLVRT